MRYKSLILTLLLLASCTPRLLNDPIRYGKYQRQFEIDRKAALLKVDFRSDNHKEPYRIYKRSLEFAVTNAIYNSGKFSEVCTGSKIDSCINNRTYFFDIDFEVYNFSELGYYKKKSYWYIAWLAIYPMPFYFPVQPRSGRVVATLTARILDLNNKELALIQLEREQEYNIFFYGFLRTQPVESTGQMLYEKLLSELNLEIKNHKLFTEI